MIDLLSKNYETTQNFFVEYPGKSDLNSHFGVLQRAFNEYERTKNIRSVYDVHLCFLEYFDDSETFVLVDVYDDPGR